MDTRENNMASGNTNGQTKFCQHCGAKIDAKAVICPKCGVPVAGAQQVQVNPDDKNNGWWNLLGFFFPIVGWILWGVWHKEYQKRARGICTWSWIGFGIGFVIGFISAL